MNKLVLPSGGSECNCAVAQVVQFQFNRQAGARSQMSVVCTMSRPLASINASG